MLVHKGVRRFKCATIREAEVLFQAAGKTKVELLVAMSMYGANLDDLCAYACIYKQHNISTLTESPEHAKLVRKKCPSLKLWIDLDPNNWHRHGIPLEQYSRIKKTAKACADKL